MKNPWIFRQAADLLAGRPYRAATLEERRDVILQHFRLIREAEEDVPKRMMGKLKTFTGWYTHGVPKGTELRRRIQSLPTPEAFLEAVESFFALRIEEREGRVSAPEGEGDPPVRPVLA
jgi:tRNA-dihydrouridine synthase